MQLQQVAITWTHKTNIVLVIKSVDVDISRIIVTKIWSEWTTFLLIRRLCVSWLLIVGLKAQWATIEHSKVLLLAS
jgi:hypothetical protein